MKKFISHALCTALFVFTANVMLSSNQKALAAGDEVKTPICHAEGDPCGPGMTCHIDGDGKHYSCKAASR